MTDTISGTPDAPPLEPEESRVEAAARMAAEAAVAAILPRLAALEQKSSPAPAPAPPPAPAVPAEVLDRLEAVEAAAAALASVPVPEPLQRAIDDARLATTECRHAIKNLTERNN